MITTPTTFVVGAGASCPYGLPASANLHKKARDLQPRTDVYQMLLATGLQVGELNDFLEDLRQHPAPSIDAFLEPRQDRPATMRVGRRVIALLMAEAILAMRERDPTAGESDWLGYVIERMRRGAATPSDFAGGNCDVRFVTFNFDSIIENRIAKAIRSISRGGNDRVIEAAVAAMCRVIHVHGRLPELPSVPLRIDEFGSSHGPWVEWLVRAETEIRVILDDINPSTLSAARECVSRPGVLCFLGLGMTGRT
jgi:hypothetical protein